jgi:hypothetical protein
VLPVREGGLRRLKAAAPAKYFSGTNYDFDNLKQNGALVK